jgi:hypothetical protein
VILKELKECVTLSLEIASAKVFYRPGAWAAVRGNSNLADKKKIHRSKCRRNGS